MLKFYTYILLVISFNTLLGQSIINCKVIDENKNGIENVLIKDLISNKVTSTDSSGHFTLNIIDENVIVRISHIGYETKEILSSKLSKEIFLKNKITQLEEIEVDISINDKNKIVNKVIDNYKVNHCHDSILYSVFYRGEPEEWYPVKAQNIFEICLTMNSEKGSFTGKVDSMRVKNISNIDESKIKITDLDYFNMLKSLTRAYAFDKSKYILSKDNPNFFKNSKKLSTYSILSTDIGTYGGNDVYILKLENSNTNKELVLTVDKKDYGIYTVKYDKNISFFVKKGGKYYRKGHRSANSFSYFIDAEKLQIVSSWTPNLKPGVKYNDFVTEWKSNYWKGLNYEKLFELLQSSILSN